MQLGFIHQEMKLNSIQNHFIFYPLKCEIVKVFPNNFSLHIRFLIPTEIELHNKIENIFSDIQPYSIGLDNCTVGQLIGWSIARSSSK